MYRSTPIKSAIRRGPPKPLPGVNAANNSASGAAGTPKSVRSDEDSDLGFGGSIKGT